MILCFKKHTHIYICTLLTQPTTIFLGLSKLLFFFIEHTDYDKNAQKNCKAESSSIQGREVERAAF